MLIYAVTLGCRTEATTYDAAGRMLSTATPQGTVSYTYTTAGQRARMTLPGNRTVQYGYDDSGRLETLTDWHGEVTSFGYDRDGRRTSITRPNGVVTTNTYDAAGRITGVSHAKGTTPLKSFTYTYDATGNRVSATSGAGTETYTLDALGRLTSVSYPGGGTETYTYDATGNRTSTTAGGTTTAYTYDDADQLLTEGSVTYTYDAAGNVTGRGGDTFTWDWRNRLTEAKAGSTTTRYAYDGDDVRVAKTQGTATTTYLWDRESGLPLLVDDGTTGYVHAGGVLEQIETGDGTPQHLLGDALGSVRGATDDAGTLTGSADYDVFGAVRGTSTVDSLFGFTGEQFDTETGFLHLRARQYDPTSGRFLSTDTVQPNAPGTQGYNLYAYVANNPTTWADPSGHSANLAGPLATVLTSHAYAVALQSPTFGAALAAATAAALTGARTPWGTIGLSVIGILVVTCWLTECPAYDLARLVADQVLDQVRPRPGTTTTTGGPAPGPSQRPRPGESPAPRPTAPPPVIPAPQPDDRDACDQLGRWGPAHPGGAPPDSRAASYQTQITGRPTSQGFYVTGSPVEFDGCSDGILLEAKGCGYARLVQQQWWLSGAGAQGMRTQAEAQQRAASQAGAPLIWHVAESAAAQAIAMLFRQWGVTEIHVHHTLAVPPCQ